MQHDKKHIVLLTTWYPPLQSIAVSRMKSFAKYLDHTKFRLTVVTIGTDQQYGLAQEEYGRVFRIKPPRRIFHPTFNGKDSKIWHYTKVAWKKLLSKFSGDEQGFFVSGASAYLLKLDKEDKIDLVISSFSPAAPHLAALKFCQTSTAKWIVDMRDEMSLNPQSDASTRRFYAGIEEKISKRASALTSVSQPIVDYFKTSVPGLREYVEIRNGFDCDVLDQPYHFNETFTLLHAGSFYGTRKPDTLLKALSNLHTAGKMPSSWKFCCAGAARNFSIPDAIKDHVEILPRVSNDESFSLMCAADLNVLVQPPTGRKGVYTGKLFEYMATRKYILAVVDPEDVAADLIREYKAGYVAGFTDISAIEQCLLQAINAWKQKEKLVSDPQRIMHLHRKFQVQKLNLLIEKVLHEN